jgi:hypothetical protein
MVKSSKRRKKGKPKERHNSQEPRKRARASPSLGKPTIIGLLLKS